MDIKVNHSLFEQKQLSVKAASFFSGIKLFYDGKEVKGNKNQYIVQDESGKDIEIYLKPTFFDPIPKLQINGESVILARPLKWYEYVWMGLPILLVFNGGALGVFFGVGALYANAQIFRGDRSPFMKYLMTGIMSIVSAILFFVCAMILFGLIHGKS